VLLVGAENTGKTCLVASFLGEEFVEGQAATEGADVDVCKIYCRDWKRISNTEKTDYLHHQFVDHYRGSALKRLLTTSSSKSNFVSTALLSSQYQSKAIVDNSSYLNPPSIKSPSDPYRHNMLSSFPSSTQYDSDSLNVVVWDFAGQKIFHNTHSIFISEDGVPVMLQ